MEELLSVNEFARRAGGLSPFTIHAWLSSGKLRRTKLGRRTMIRESELLRLIEEGDGRKSPGRPRRKAGNAQIPLKSQPQQQAAISPATPSDQPAAEQDQDWEKF